MPKYDLISEEIKWCESNRNPEQKVYQDGFIAGLQHALFLMKSSPVALGTQRSFMIAPFEYCKKCGLVYCYIQNIECVVCHGELEPIDGLLIPECNPTQDAPTKPNVGAGADLFRAGVICPMCQKEGHYGDECPNL